MSKHDVGLPAGHQFRFAVTVQGSYAIVGDPQHHDSDTVSEPFRLTVRAWNLPEACRIAAQTPLHRWQVNHD